MKKYLIMTVLTVIAVSGLTGCGGGVGDSTITKATTKIYLFGNITSANKVVASVKTTMNVPIGILVNYSSAPGATSGLCKLRKGTVVPSGPVKETGINSGDTYGTFDIASRTLNVNLFNGSLADVKSSTTANSAKGTEIATINFTLAIPGVTPPAMPLQDSAAEVGIYTLSPLDLSYSSDSNVNFVTTYQ